MNASHHTKAQTFHLSEYVRTHYAESKLNDGDFAERAAASLGFSVSPHHVSESRKIFGIPNNRVMQAKERAANKPKNPDVAALMECIAAAEQRITALEAQERENLEISAHLVRHLKTLEARYGVKGAAPMPSELLTKLLARAEATHKLN